MEEINKKVKLVKFWHDQRSLTDLRKNALTIDVAGDDILASVTITAPHPYLVDAMHDATTDGSYLDLCVKAPVGARSRLHMIKNLRDKGEDKAALRCAMVLLDELVVK